MWLLMPPDATVHPHVRGEHIQWYLSGDIENGSSPRAWGTQISLYLDIRTHRFIPTCVGNTGTPCVPPTTVVGSSPRAWGTRSFGSNPSGCCRFIPTCVGNTQIQEFGIP